MKFNWKYWACQIIGWGAWCLFLLYINLVVYKDIFESQYKSVAEIASAKEKFLIAVGITFIIAILVTHGIRLVLKQLDWIKYSFNKVIVIFICGAIITGYAFVTITDKVEEHFNVSLEKNRKEQKLQMAKKIEKENNLDTVAYYSSSFKPSLRQDTIIKTIKQSTRWHRNEKGNWHYQDVGKIGGIFQSVMLTSLWMLIYFIWHYVARNRKTQLVNLKLENTVKELELQTIKAHINPHFIFNSLNSIRALVDENPERARTAITELSNLLRSSMQAENNETVAFEKELKIVKDYLALEKIRFEDRLQVLYEIDQDTMQQMVPPMMLQTLVENAIKHGISKEINGGVVLIKSNFVDNHYELIVENVGTLDTSIKVDGGFGIKSTQNRLHLLYGNNATFSIVQKENNLVAATINIPVSNLINE
jgi:hypothetical protein